MIYQLSLFLSFTVALCLLLTEPVSAQLECDTGPMALTDALRTPIPQTCIEVPADNEKGIKSRTRCYYRYEPESCRGVDFPPMVVDVHGFNGCPLRHARYSGWKEKADEECMILVWPVGNNLANVRGSCFNFPGLAKADDYGTPGGNNVTTIPCCCTQTDDETAMIRNPGSGPDDGLFLKMAIEQELEDSSKKIDRNRIYMAGHSNGCIASLSMAAQYSDTVAAVCCHAGTLATPFPDSGYFPVPIWMVHGMKDTIVEYEGSTRVSGFDFGEYGFWSMDQTMGYLAHRNGCEEGEAIETDISDDKGKDIVGKTTQYTGCNADVELVTLFESGHWPYKLGPLWQGIVSGFGEPLTNVDTTAMAWDFCKVQNKEDIIIEESNETSSAFMEFSARASRASKLLSGVLFCVLVLSSLL